METVNISGFGGGYELCCQKMLWNGIRWIQGNPELAGDLEFQQYENVTGLCVAKNANADALEKAMMNGVDGITGAMHHVVCMHLSYIGRNGLKKWISEFPTDRRYEFDGTEKSIPVKD